MEPTRTIQETEADIIENFSMFDQWLDKYEYLIELGKTEILGVVDDDAPVPFGKGCKLLV